MSAPITPVVIVIADPDDDHVLACAVAAGADLIISGDSDLLDLKAHQGIPIVPPPRHCRACPMLMQRQKTSSVFVHVEYPQDEDIVTGYFVPNFVICHQNPADLAGLKFRQAYAQPRVDGNPFRSCHQLANRSNCGRDVNGLEKLV